MKAKARAFSPTCEAPKQIPACSMGLDTKFESWEPPGQSRPVSTHGSEAWVSLSFCLMISTVVVLRDDYV